MYTKLLHIACFGKVAIITRATMLRCVISYPLTARLWRAHYNTVGLITTWTGPDRYYYHRQFTSIIYLPSEQCCSCFIMVQRSSWYRTNRFGSILNGLAVDGRRTRSTGRGTVRKGTQSTDGLFNFSIALAFCPLRIYGHVMISFLSLS